MKREVGGQLMPMSARSVTLVQEAIVQSSAAQALQPQIAGGKTKPGTLLQRELGKPISIEKPPLLNWDPYQRVLAVHQRVAIKSRPSWMPDAVAVHKPYHFRVRSPRTAKSGFPGGSHNK